ncbi:MAG TPA: hypothetical protein VJV75_12945 [Candidatus Polarisedimenticolia bacterium]|nr:hypothetical protein [Candidatus Polarisedimenticolia bacterium]
MNSKGNVTKRPAYVAPNVVSYDESQVAEDLGPVMLSGTGTRLDELSGNTATTRGTSAKPRR